MKIYANFRQEADINPIDVIKKLLEEKIGVNGTVFIDQEKYYHVYQTSRGFEPGEERIEISKETYFYIVELKSILSYLKKREFSEKE